MDIKSNNTSTFDALYDKYAEKVYQVSLYYSRNHHAAEDVTQTVFMIMYKNMSNIRESEVGAWLKLIAKHMALNYNRTYQHEEIVPYEEVEELIDNDVYIESTEAIFQDKFTQSVRAELAEKIYDALYRENERWFHAITIVYILERPQKDVAETMGISLGALQVMLHRAKRWMRKRYQKEYDHLNDA